LNTFCSQKRMEISRMRWACGLDGAGSLLIVGEN
jgi:hypothetical protein